MKKYRFIILILTIFLILVNGCGKKESDTSIFLNSKNSTDINTSKSSVQNGNLLKSNITMEFMKNRYPGKEVIVYMYADPEIYNNEFIPRYTDEQIIALNDYLTENNQDYVIYFDPVQYESMTINYVKERVEGDNPPDIISSVESGDIIKTDNSTEKMISENIFEKLEDINSEYYDKYISTMPSSIYELSKFYNEFYGFKNTFFYNEKKCL